jgi:dTDP-glucose 4,6-dehydratase
MATLLVTGGAGFIGSALVRRLIARTSDRVATIDCLTYAGRLAALEEAANDPRHAFHKVDVADAPAVRAVFEREQPDAVLHLAAESHVDRSISGPAPFIHTNLVGTYTMLEEALRYWRALGEARRDAFRFVHVSTDEVFGALGAEGAFTAESPYRPRSPYAASKAGADHLARAWHHTFGLPVIVTNCSNNFGPWQFPEKLIPVVIRQALAGAPIPVYARGENVRDWLFVDDHAAALDCAVRRGRPGGTYVFAGGTERRNIDLVRAVCAVLDRRRPRAAGPHADLITFVADRPGHDFRYSLDDAPTRAELGWAPAVGFDEGLERTVAWYLEHPQWLA